MKNVYKCEYIGRYDPYDDFPNIVPNTRHCVRMLEDNVYAMADKGEIVNTSPDVFFSRKDGVLVTRNSVYLFDNTGE